MGSSRQDKFQQLSDGFLALSEEEAERVSSYSDELFRPAEFGGRTRAGGSCSGGRGEGGIFKLLILGKYFAAVLEQ